MPRLTQAAIRATRADSKLLDMLLAQLTESLPPSTYEDPEQLVAAMQRLPVGLRAMASTYQLDVSMALDDLGWHFANWFDEGYAEETSRGLKELGADEIAAVFDQAREILNKHLDEFDAALNDDVKDFVDWYPTSAMHHELKPLNERLWAILQTEHPGEEPGLFRYWVAYARKYPERVAP
jgi:hypothetical protein